MSDQTSRDAHNSHTFKNSTSNYPPLPKNLSFSISELVHFNAFICQKTDLKNMRCAVVPTSRHRSKRHPPRRGPDGAPVRPERHGIGFSCSFQRVQNALAPKHGTTSKTNTQPEITCDALASSNRRAPSNLYNRNNAPRQPCPLELM